MTRENHESRFSGAKTGIAFYCSLEGRGRKGRIKMECPILFSALHFLFRSAVDELPWLVEGRWLAKEGNSLCYNLCYTYPSYLFTPVYPILDSTVIPPFRKCQTFSQVGNSRESALPKDTRTRQRQRRHQKTMI